MGTRHSLAQRPTKQWGVGFTEDVSVDSVAGRLRFFVFGRVTKSSPVIDIGTLFKLFIAPCTVKGQFLQPTILLFFLTKVPGSFCVKMNRDQLRAKILVFTCRWIDIT